MSQPSQWARVSQGQGVLPPSEWNRSTWAYINYTYVNPARTCQNGCCGKLCHSGHFMKYLQVNKANLKSQSCWICSSNPKLFKLLCQCSQIWDSLLNYSASPLEPVSSLQFKYSYLMQLLYSTVKLWFGVFFSSCCGGVEAYFFHVLQQIKTTASRKICA